MHTHTAHPTQQPPQRPLEDATHAALALCSLARTLLPGQASVVLSHLTQELEDDHALEMHLRAERYSQAAQWLLERTHGPAKPSAPLLIRVNRVLSTLRAEALGLEAWAELSAAQRHLQCAFEALKAQWLERTHPDGYGGHPALRDLRRVLLLRGTLTRDTDFDALESRVRTLITQADHPALCGLLDPTSNPYSCAAFTQLTGRTLPRHAALRAEVIRAALDPQRLAAFEAHQAQQLEARRAQEQARTLATLEGKLDTQAMQGYGTLLGFAQHLLRQEFRLRLRRSGAVQVTDALSSDGTLYYPQLRAELRDYLRLRGMPTVVSVPG